MPPDVALVAPYPSPGLTHAGSSGVASYTALLARALAGAGAAVTVVAPRLADAPPRHRDGAVDVLRTFAPGPLALPRALAHARRTGAEVVHLQMETFLYGGIASLPGAIAALAAGRRTGTPTVVTLHHVIDPNLVTSGFARLHGVGAPAPLARAGLQTLTRSLGRLAHASVVLEAAFEDHVPGAVTIPHGVGGPSGPGREAARRRLGLEGERRPVVLSFGFLAPYKGLETALAAASLAPEVRLVVAGGPHPRVGQGYITELRRRWGDHADFVGHVPDHQVGWWHEAADLALLCHPVPHATSGALALALGHGLPILASPALARVAALPPPCIVSTRPAALAARLRHLAGSPERVDALREVTSGLALARDWSTVAARHMGLYQRVALGATGRAQAAARQLSVG